MQKLLLLSISTVLFGEVRVMTLAQVLEVAGRQNPQVAIARLEQRRAGEMARAARDPFYPKIFAGSGLAYSSGFPMSIEGSAPSVVQAKAIASIYNRPQRLMLEKAREDARTAGVASSMKEDEVAHRAAILYLEAGRTAAAARSAKEQLANLKRVADSVKARIEEGRELAIEGRRAVLRSAQASQRTLTLETAAADAEAQLALLLGFPDGDHVRPADDAGRVNVGLVSQEAAAAEAVKNSKEAKRLESAMIAKGWEIKSYEAAKYPQMDLVAQYGLFAKFNNYDQYFNQFSRHNGQIGLSVQVPIFPSLASRAQKEAVSAEVAALRAQLRAEQGRASAAARKAWQEIAAREAGAEVAKLDLEVAREQTTLLIALFEEGRATQKQLEEARYIENEKWMGLFDARYALDRSRLDLLHETGTLLATLRN